MVIPYLVMEVLMVLQRSDDTFVVGQGTKVMDFDLSPDGTGLSGRTNQANDIVFVQVTLHLWLLRVMGCSRFMS